MSGTVNVGTIEGLLKWKADDTELKKSLDEVAKKVGISRAQLSQYNREIDSVNSTYKKVAASIDPAIAAEQKYEKAHAALSQALKLGLIDHEKFNDLLGKAKVKFSETESPLHSLIEGISKLTGSLGPVGREAHEMAEGLGGAAGKVGILGEAVAGLGPLLPIVVSLAATLIGVGLGFAAFEVIKGAIEKGLEFQAVVNRLNDSLRNTGSYSRLSSAEILELAGSYALLTGRTKEDEAAAALQLTRFKNLTEDAYPRALDAVNAYARATGNTAEEAAKKLGPALDGNSRSLRTLKEIGVDLTRAQQVTLSKMVETGDVVGYQTKLFDILTEKVGKASAVHETLGVQVGRAKFVFGEFQEGIASEVIPALEDLAKDVINQLGGWDSLKKKAQDFGHFIGNELRQDIYTLIIGFHEMAFSWDGVAIAIDKFILDTLYKFRNLSDTLAVLPIFGSDVFQLASNALTKGIATATEATIRDTQAQIGHKNASDLAVLGLIAHKQALEGDTNVMAAHKSAQDDITAAAKREKEAADMLLISLLKIDNAREAIARKSQDELSDTRLLLAAQLTGVAAYENQKRALEGVKQERALIAPLMNLEAEANLKVAERVKKLKEEYDNGKISYEAYDAKKKEAEADGRGEIAVIEATIHAVKIHSQEVAIDRAVMEDWAKGQKVASEAAQDWGLHVGKVFLDIIALKKSLDDKLSASSAEFTDWQTQTEFAEKYGSSLAEIYKKYGLLSKASEELTIQEEIRREVEKEGLNNGLPWFEGQIAEIEKAIRSYHTLNDTIASTHAAEEIQKNINQPLLDGVKQWESAGIDGFNNWLETGKFDAESFKKTFLDITIKMIEEWLLRWYAAIAAKTAAEIAGNQAAAASSATSGGGSGGMMSFASSGISRYFSGGGSSASASGASSGMAAMGGTIAVFAVIYALAKNWLDHHQREFEQIRISAGNAGSLGSSLGSITAGADHLGAVADEMIKTVSGIINNLGGVIEGWTGDLTVSRSGHGKHTEYWVQFANGLIQRFGNDANAAMEFATVQALKQSNIGGLPIEVQNAIHNSAAQTVDAINGEITQAYQDVAARLGNVGQQVYDIFKKYASGITDRIKQAFTDISAALVSSTHGGSGKPGPEFGGPGNGPSDGQSTNFVDMSKAAKQDTSALTADLKAITDLIAGRNREVESIENSLIGVNDASSKRLADIASFDRGYEEARNLVTAQIQLVQQKLADLGDKTGEEADKLRAALNSYIGELNKLPEAITGQKLDMAIFDTLYQYLQASPKYAKEAAAWAKVKVEIEFAQIKLQLQLLGKWEQFMGMFNDAYNAALQLAGKPPTHAGGGGGKDGVKSFIEDRQFQLALAGMDALHQKLAQIKKDYDAQLLAAGHDQKLRQQLLALQQQETAAAIAANKKTVADQFEALINPENSFSQFEKQYDDLRKSITDAGYGADRTARMLARLTAAEAAAEHTMSETQASGLFGDLANVITDAGLKNKLLAEQQIITFQLKEIEMKQEYALLLAKGQLNAEEKKLFADAFGWIDSHAADLPGGANWTFGADLTTAATDLSSAADNTFQAANALQSAAQSMLDYQTSLRTDSSLGMVDPRTALNNAKSDYEALAAKALTGDTSAIAGFKDAAETYRKDLMAFSPSSELLANMLSGIDATINQIKVLPSVVSALSPDTVAVTTSISGVGTVIKDTGNITLHGIQDVNSTLTTYLADNTAHLVSFNTSAAESTSNAAQTLQQFKAANTTLSDLTLTMALARKETTASNDERFSQLEIAISNLEKIAHNTHTTPTRSGPGG